MTDRQRFEVLRKRLFAYIDEMLERCDHCKHYEGAFYIAEMLPNRFDARDNDAATWRIHLDCYLVGPHRHYDWDAPTFAKALDACESDLNEWMRDE